MANVSNTIGGLLGASGSLPTTSSSAQQWAGQLQAGNTVTPTGALGYPYAQQSYPVATPQPIYYQPSVPVIPHDHPEPIHFKDKAGHVHSYDIHQLFKLIGLEW